MSADDGNPKAPAIWGSIWSIFGIAALTVALRFKARKIRQLAWGSDDYMALVALAFTGATCVSSTLAGRYGVGKHMWDVSTPSLQAWHRSLFWGNMVYVSTGPSVKISALLMYQRVFAVPQFRLIARILCGLCVAWHVAEICGCIWNCVPIKGFWDKSIPAKCVNTRNFDLQYAVINISLDAIILALPIKMVLGLQLSKARKIGLVILFLMGGFATLAAIIRLLVFIRNYQSPDETYVWYEGVIWSCLEPEIAVISICLPVMRPVILAALPERLRSALLSRTDRFFGGVKPAAHFNSAATFSNFRSGKRTTADGVPVHRPFVFLESDDVPLQPMGGGANGVSHSEARASGGEATSQTGHEALGDVEAIYKTTDVELRYEVQKH